MCDVASYCRAGALLAGWQTSDKLWVGERLCLRTRDGAAGTALGSMPNDLSLILGRKELISASCSSHVLWYARVHTHAQINK